LRFLITLIYSTDALRNASEWMKMVSFKMSLMKRSCQKSS
jgi:hypothetical protein